MIDSNESITVAGLAVETYRGEDLTALWYAYAKVREACVRPLSRSARTSRDIVQESQHDAGFASGSIPVVESQPDKTADAISESVRTALAILEKGSPAVTLLWDEEDITAITLARCTVARDAGNTYAVIAGGDFPCEMLSDLTAPACALAALAIFYRVRLPGLFNNGCAKPMPWIHPTSQQRAIRIGKYILRECANRIEMQPPLGDPAERLFLLGASSIAQLQQRLRILEESAAQLANADLTQFVTTHGRNQSGTYRLALVVSSLEDLRAKLRDCHALFEDPVSTINTPVGIYFKHIQQREKLAMLFPGQGSQYPGMLTELSLRMPAMRRWFDALDEAYCSSDRPRPSSILTQQATDDGLTDMDTGAQLGLVASLAMAEALRGLGVHPDCVLGHSNGEHVAMAHAGWMGAQSPESYCDEIAKVNSLAERSVAPQTQEAMLAVSILRSGALDVCFRTLPSNLFLAVDNCPTQALLGGTAEAIEQAASVLHPPIALCSRLPFRRAHHTPLFADWAALLRSYFESIEIIPSDVPVYSAATTEVLPRDPSKARDWMSLQWRQTVRFRETIERMHEDGVRIFVEAGPGDKLTGFVNDTLRHKPRTAIAASSSVRSEWRQILNCCAQLYSLGVDIQTATLDDCYGVEPVWEKQKRTPLESVIVPATQTAAVQDKLPPSKASPRLTALRHEHERLLALIEAANHRIQERIDQIRPVQTPKLRNAIDTRNVRNGGPISAGDNDAVFRLSLSATDGNPLLQDHAMGTDQLGGQALIVVPFTWTLNLIADALKRFNGEPCGGIRSARAHRWLALDRGRLQLEIRTFRDSSGQLRCEVHEVQQERAYLAFEATGNNTKSDRKLASHAETPQQRLRPVSHWPPQRFYEQYAFHGPSYRLLKSVRISGERIEAEIYVKQSASPRPQIDPALLDCAGQLTALWILEDSNTRPGAFPFALDAIEIGAPLPHGDCTVLCSGQVSRSVHGVTSAGFDFTLPNGVLLWRVINLQQKLTPFRGHLEKILFGKLDGPSASRSTDISSMISSLYLDRECEEFFNSGQGIWSRVLAHAMLSPQMLDVFYTQNPSTRFQWLKGQIEPPTVSSVSPQNHVSSPAVS